MRRATGAGRIQRHRDRISIHALLAESDSYQPGGNSILHISIHALLAESDISPPFRWLSRCISIHALLAESDGNGQEMAAQCVEFLSTLSLRRATTGHGSQGGAGHRFLSTLSLRRATMPASWIFATPTNFYPRSPCGERPHRSALCGCLPLISIHALLAESDLLKL